MNIAAIYLDSAKKRFLSYKELGEKSIAQVDDQQIHWKPEENSNSITIIVKHMSGNMLSRFSDFLTTDGEKPWRERDAEFEEENCSKAQLLAVWEKGWKCLMDTLNSLQEEDLSKTVYIREEPLPVVDALNRQLAHHAYHVGQIVYIAKALKADNWHSLSIPKKRI
ncbi:MAG TPA: DUF1572 family protein [Chitinophagaceae bacterium]